MNPATVLILIPAMNVIKENKAGSSVQRSAHISELLDFSPLFLVQKAPKCCIFIISCCFSLSSATSSPAPPIYTQLNFLSSRFLIWSRLQGISWLKPFHISMWKVMEMCSSCLRVFYGGFLKREEATWPRDSATTFNLVMLTVHFVEICGVDIGKFSS